MKYYCRNCQEVVEVYADINHGLHWIAIIMTAGLWWFAYIMILVSHQKCCAECGNRVEVSDRIEFFRKKPTEDNKLDPYNKYTDKEMENAVIYAMLEKDQKLDIFKGMSLEELEVLWLERQYSKKYGFYAQPPKGSVWYER